LWAMLWIDLDTQFIFNVMTYPSIFLGILYNGSKGNLKWSLAGGLLAWCLFEAIVFLGIWLLQKEGMGGGDVKLAVLLGIWLGPARLMVALGLAFVTGSLVGLLLLAIYRQSRPFPFGPFLVLGGLASLSVGDSLLSWYIDKSFW
ncbi:MAG: A24 family peptidase, partial [Candidatus Sericytochromatia bacterium]